MLYIYIWSSIVIVYSPLISMLIFESFCLGGRRPRPIYIYIYILTNFSKVGAVVRLYISDYIYTYCASRRIKLARGKSLDSRNFFAWFFFPNSVLPCSFLGNVEWFGARRRSAPRRSCHAPSGCPDCARHLRRGAPRRRAPNPSLQPVINQYLPHTFERLFSRNKRERKSPRSCRVVKCQEFEGNIRRNELRSFDEITRFTLILLDFPRSKTRKKKFLRNSSENQDFFLK